MDGNPYISLILVLVFWLGRYLYTRYESKKGNDALEQSRKNQYKKLLEERQIRTNINLYDEKKFWSLIDEIRIKSKNYDKQFYGLLKDSLLKFSLVELIEIDNLLLSFYHTFLNKEVNGASQIIFKSDDIGYTILLMNYLISKGEVQFKNTCLNNELLDKIEISELLMITLRDIIEEVYEIKSRKLIPKVDKENISYDISKSSIYQEEELPSVFPNLWMRFT